MIDANNNNETVTFVGDSITALRDTPPKAWFTPMMRYFGNVNAINKGVVSDTTYRVIDRLADIKSSNADLYVIAIGVNDIRHYIQLGEAAADYCAKTEQEFLDNMETIINYLKPAEVHIVSIWPSFPGDPRGDSEVFNVVINQWNVALIEFCNAQGVGYSNITHLLTAYINTPEEVSQYVPDGIHPNNNGKELYSRAVLWETI